MSFHNPFDLCSDPRRHEDQGPSRNARLAKVTLPGGGIISRGEDGRIAVAGRESLRILRVTELNQSFAPSHAPMSRLSSRIESSRNLWEGSGLKIDCASTDAAWAYGIFSNKVLTSARNGELIMWDLNKSGHSKYERKTKEHLRSIHAMTVSRIVHHYCMTGSADGDFRVWDLRDIQSSVMRVHNPAAVRRVIFSPCVWNPLYVLVGMDNGTLHRWDLKMGQRGLLDRLPVAHTSSITTMDWYSGGEDTSHGIAISGAQGPDDYTGNTLGWFASAGLDRCVKVWNLTGPEAGTRMPNKPTYTLHPSYPIRRIIWRPGFECELAVVSHADFTVSSHVDHLHPTTTSGTPSGALSRVGSGLGLDSILKNFASEPRPTPKEAKGSLDRSGPIVDAVEVWDVRRSWLPKWSVMGTSAEGGVTDIEFADSHTLWTQNTNGAFAQLDMRDISKPLDAISRTSVTWNPRGTMAFVTDHVPRWELPYDDTHFNYRNHDVGPPKGYIKRIGDPSFRPKTQKLGVFAPPEAHLESDIFCKLARTYLIDGNDRPALCASNIQAAMDVGKVHVAQVWMLMATSLAKEASHPPSSSHQPLPSTNTSLNNTPQHPASSSTRMTAPFSFPSNSSSSKSPDTCRQRRASSHHYHTLTNLENSSRVGRRSPSTSQRPTPNSSKSSSPLHLPITLPPITPRKPSFLGGRRDPAEISLSARRSALLRRQSVSSSVHYSASPVDRNSASVKNAGEGVLSDSDSSPGSDDEGSEQTMSVESTDEEIQPLPNMLNPSPLSRMMDHRQWTEDEGDKDEDEASSPSPRSTDTEPDDSNSARHKQRPNKIRRNSLRVASRSRSSTLASLAAPSRSLAHQDSHSSIRTITAAETSFLATDPPGLVHKDESTRDPSGRHRAKPSHSTRDRQDDQVSNDIIIQSKTLTERRPEIVASHEVQILEHCWEILREILEELVEAGDVQTCAVMASIAPQQLKLSKRRILHFFDTYINQLVQSQLYTCAAYFRKHSGLETIKNMSLLDTTIHTTCGRCNKPLVKASGQISDDSWKYPTFSHCPSCRVPTATCTICRLPVRTMLFQCSICRHGGHQSCYQRYYLNQPMLDLPVAVPLADHRGRPPARTTVADESTRSSIHGSTEEGNTQYSGGSPPAKQSNPFMVGRELVGHPCAAGCGHFCWAAPKQS